MKLKVPQLTIATAVVFCHRFFHVETAYEFDTMVMATACLFLAGKVEETPKPLNDLAHTSYYLQQKRNDPTHVEGSEQEGHVELRETILRAERILLHRLAFDFNVQHPYKHLLSVIKRLSQTGLIEEDSTKSLAQVSWNFANDSLRTSLCLEYDAKHIAEAVVYLATKFLSSKFELPKKWWESVDIDPNTSELIGNRILDLYEQSGREGVIHVQSSV
ncbi:Cyclin, N-terminal [Ostreococcus tauri]|uniref:Cyclin, N-terminal n=1 Tax=Ostreococcus tauri TaxID=70448 RepID=A0A090MDP0_OSTTA|nr:Cyclin, N-terminal [Ostreococcus tauri]CEG01046.1 Cyclin, N-terminal [Ostreococcus tauri]|eukprot:XP_003075071.2 Cyclin, N-terminal [Ostreococcus tauri]